MSSSAVDNWGPVFDSGAEDTETTLIHRRDKDGLKDSLREPFAADGSKVGNSSGEEESDSHKCKGEKGDEEVEEEEEEEEEKEEEDEEKKKKRTQEFNDQVSKEHIEIPKLSPAPPEKASIRRKSGSSLDAVPITLKSSPADPHLSDVNSVSSTASVTGGKNTALNSVNDIIGIREKEASKNDAQSSADGSQPPSGAANFFDSMISSLSFKQSPQQPPENGRPTHAPDIISHRRQPSSNSRKYGKKANSPPNPSSPLKKAEKPKEILRQVSLHDPEPFDPKRFVEETYMDTPFHYASPERDTEFHNLFKSVPETDRLLDDFSCALSREFLYQGRIYVSESHLCFSSSLLGWIAKVITPFKDVTYMEKTSTAGLFPNAISIETEMGKTQFNGFISRDAAFTLLKEVWSRTLLAQGDRNSDNLKTSASEVVSTDGHQVEGGFGNRSYTDLIRPNEPPSRTSYISENDSIIEDAIRSVDDYTPSHYANDSGAGSADDDEDDEDEEEEEDNEEEEMVADDKSLKVKKMGFKLKPNADYEYDGPYYARATSFQYSPEENNETVLAEVELNAPPGVVFQLLFSESNPSFWLEFFKSQDSSQFSDIGRFDKVNQEGQNYREFTYAKGLHFPVGPKSTKCIVQETILHLDYSDYINVLNITRTPDVPSGGSFSTKTRYMLRWASETTSVLKVSYWVDWTASSWIKSMVESSCKSGQVAATKDLVECIKKYVSANTEKGIVNVTTSKPVSRRGKPPAKTTPLKSAEERESERLSNERNAAGPLSNQSFNGSNLIVPLLLLIIILLALNLCYQMSIKREMDRIQDSLLSSLLGDSGANLAKGRHSLMDVPAKVNGGNAIGRLRCELGNWFHREKSQNATYEDNRTLQHLISLLETLLLENAGRE